MYQRVLSALETVKYESKDTPVFKKALEWVGHFPRELDPALRRRLLEATCKAFSIGEAELWVAIDRNGFVAPNGVVGAKKSVEDLLKEREDEFRLRLPKTGWFEWYDRYTLGIECPLSYSIFSSLSVAGAALGRRVYLKMGHFNIYPNYAVILIGPPGIKKSITGDIAVKFVKDGALCPTFADQVTPEKMISVLKESGHQFMYLGEMATFFGKQRYNEGLATRMLRILDSPAEYLADTIARGPELLVNLAVSFLGCTTPSNLSKSMPDEITSSGFLSRFVLVTERDCHREFHIPQEPDKAAEIKISRQLERMKGMSGQMYFSEGADKWLKEWYHQLKYRLRYQVDETTAEVLVRAPNHMLRTAMLTHLVQHDDFHICQECMESAAKLLAYTEEEAPKTMQLLKQTVGASDLDFVVAQLVKLGGAADHSTLIRKVQRKMNTTQLRSHIKTLEEGGRVKVGKQGGATYYILVKEVEDGQST